MGSRKKCMKEIRKLNKLLLINPICSDVVVRLDGLLEVL